MTNAAAAQATAASTPKIIQHMKNHRGAWAGIGIAVALFAIAGVGTAIKSSTGLDLPKGLQEFFETACKVDVIFTGLGAAGGATYLLFKGARAQATNGDVENPGDAERHDIEIKKLRQQLAALEARLPQES